MFFIIIVMGAVLIWRHTANQNDFSSWFWTSKYADGTLVYRRVVAQLNFVNFSYKSSPNPWKAQGTGNSGNHLERHQNLAAMSFIWDLPKLKLIKKYLRSSMTQDRLNSLASLSIQKWSCKEGVESTMKRFVDLKPRKMF